MKSLFIQINTVDGIPLEAHHGGTSLNGIGNELIRLRIGEKPKTSEAIANSIILILQGKDEILYFITTLRTNSFQKKDLKKALHLIPFEGESKHMLSRIAAQRICETKFFK